MEKAITTCQFRMGQPGMTWHCGRYTNNRAKLCPSHMPKCETCKGKGFVRIGIDVEPCRTCNPEMQQTKNG